MCHISNGGIIWMKYHTQFQVTISENSWNYDFELNSYKLYSFKEVSFEWNFILISANNKNKFVKFWFGIEVVCVIFLKVVSLEWNFILISAKNKHKIDKFWCAIQVLCVIFLREVFLWMKLHANFSQKLAQISKILNWNLSGLCHIF